MNIRHALLGSLVLALSACADEPRAPTPVSPDAAPLLLSRGGKPIPDQYIVVLNDAADPAAVAGRHGASPLFTYSTALKGFAARLNRGQVQKLRNDPEVQYVEQDAVAEITQEAPGVSSVQSPATWGIDRTDQPNLPLDNVYRYTNNGAGVKVYIIDTGILTTHTQFATSRAKAGTLGFDAFAGTPDFTNGQDCHGHGTHVAGTVGGTTYGIAKNATLYSVRVLNCGGSGSFSGVIAGVDWVTANHAKPAVANMSLGCSGGCTVTSLINAVARSVSYGITYVVAAGNDNIDACTNSPSQTNVAITVGATDNTDTRAWFSNWGSCLDLFAPGVGITSAWIGSNTAINTISGTSMASPHVAGVAALILQALGSGGTPGMVSDIIKHDATFGLVNGEGPGSPDLLLNRWNGNLAGLGSLEYEPHGGSYAAGAGTHYGNLRGTAGTNFDLYLEKWNGASFAVVASNTTASTNVAITYKGTAGTYRWRVVSASGGSIAAGTFDLFVRKPI